MLHFKNKFNFLFLLIFVFSFLFSVSSVSAEWSESYGSGKRNWRGVAVSSDGQKLAGVVYAGYIHTSSNGGDTWVTRNGAGSRNWWSIASSADGTKLVAGVLGGFLYTSNDSGATWLPQNGAGSRHWNALDSSSDGNIIVASGNTGGLGSNGNVYISKDSGATWVQNTNLPAASFTGITTSDDGQKIAVATYNDYIYTSSDGGASWTPSTSLGQRHWAGIDSSSDGNKIIASATGGYGGQVYISNNGGANWSQSIGGNKFWLGVKSSADGQKLLALPISTYPYHSDGGGNDDWVLDSYVGNKEWRGLAVSRDGSVFAATTYLGNIFIYKAPIVILSPTVSLSSNQDSIESGDSVYLSWTSTNATSCIATSTPSTSSWNSSSYGPSGSRLVGPLTVDTTFTLICSGPGGNATASKEIKINASAPTVNLVASPMSVQSGASTNLTWTSTNTTSCTAGGDWSGTKSLNSTEPETIPNITTNKTFTLTCVNASGVSNTASVSVAVLLPIEVTLTANPSSVPAGGTTQLVWTTTNNPTTCTASGDWSGTKGTASPNGGGSEIIQNIKESKSFTITCTKGSLTATATANVNVFNSPVVTLVANPTSIVSGASSELTWTVENANTCTATGGWEGSKNTIGGTETISNISDTTTFTLTCNGNGGNASSSATVSVLASPTVTLTANPASIFEGQSTTLSWTSTNATSCVATNGWLGSKPLQGVEVISNLTQKTIFTLKCTGSGGEKTSFVEVDVVKENVSLRNSRVLQGKTVLSWTAVNVKNCEARTSNPDSGLGWQGVKTSSPSPYNGQTTNVLVTAISPDTTEYSLNCFGSVSNAPVSYKLNLHTASPASGGTSIPNYQEN